MSAALFDQLEAHARKRPRASAITARDRSGAERTWDWATLLSRTCALAEQLPLGGSGGPLWVALPNGPELVAALLGGLWAGRRVLPLAPDTPAQALRALASQSAVGAAIARPALLQALPRGVLRLDPDRRVSPRAGGGRRPEPSPAGALLLRSSGTTGTPRIACRDLPALQAVGAGSIRHIGVSEDDCILITVPIYHSYGLEQAVFTSILAGCPTLIHQGFDANAVREALVSGRISVFPAVPIMLDALARGGSARAPRLRRAFTAGTPLPRRVFDAFERSYGVRTGQVYGASEFGAISFNDPDAPDFDPESAGALFDGIEARILEAHADEPDGGTRDPGEPRGLPAGSEGELAIAGPSALTAYVGDGAPPLDGRWVRSGDLGILDARGRLRITGRRKHLIDVGGLKVNPAEVETALLEHPGVREVVVLPLPYTDTASRLRAVIVPEPGRAPSRDALRAFALRRLIPYQVPRRFEIREDVPRSATGKILRQKLQGEIGA